ncbi:unnamed protein product [Allacma fusca]|uniref:Ectonucleotide pyrophosphatase/phosphodiesterase n=1 Tax=Allacma fusca TaxID=39272 RepID=A0A8J2J0F5_9HEXA|nr:unnamed protein product [Allacma fusca]
MALLHTTFTLTLPFLIFVTRNYLIFALNPPNLSKHPVVIIIVSFDGFRYDYMNKTRTPNLDRVKENGVSVPYMRNQFPTKSLPNPYSIVTGLYPESHGIVSNIVYDPFYRKELVGYMYDPGYWNFSMDVDSLTSPIVSLYIQNS